MEEKYKLRDEAKEELRDSIPNNIKPEDLEIDEHIDDKYTSSVFARYKNGNSKNKWFLWSGYLSVVFGVLCVISMAILGIVFAVRSGDLRQDTTYDYDGNRTKILISCIIVSVVGIIGFIVGLKVTSFASYSQEELIDHVWLIVGVAILQFFFGGFIFVILTIVGYFVGIGSDYGAIYYNRIDNSSEQYRKLKDAKSLYQNGVIDYDEYMRLRQEILRNSDINSWT